MAYSELIKNFECIRAYMRDFYVYGFKSREEYDRKSVRSYDDERRRLESWMPDNMRFVRNADGKITFISIDSRNISHNPLYKAWKAKSFTDKDVTLHFILFDILHDRETALSLPEILDRIDGYLGNFEHPHSFDESTVRKKLNEYRAEGIIEAEKQGKRVIYRRADDKTVQIPVDALDFFSEILPCGVVGSFLLDKQESREGVFGFKHHYLTDTLDSDILAALFDAISKRAYVNIENLSRSSDSAHKHRIVPLRVLISAQNGRQHILAYHSRFRKFVSFRTDYITSVEICEECESFDELRDRSDRLRENMWGVSCTPHSKALEAIEFTVKIGEGEWHIINRLYRERRIGRVERIDKSHYRFSAEVVDSSELIPWIRTFICRITEFKCSNIAAENCFKADVVKMYKAYGIGGED